MGATKALFDSFIVQTVGSSNRHTTKPKPSCALLPVYSGASNFYVSTHTQKITKCRIILTGDFCLFLVCVGFNENTQLDKLERPFWEYPPQ